MRYAVMSDVHSNPAALEMALEDARRFSCDRYVLLGDTTGYGYDVEGAVRLVRSKFDVVLMGNHDSACLGREPAREVAACRNYDIDVRQGRELSHADRVWLGRRKLVLKERGAVFSHGSFFDPAEWGYVLSVHDAAENFHECSAGLMFCGHTHKAAVWEERPDGKVRQKMSFGSPAVKPESRSFSQAPGCRYIVDVGSVGYPRNDLCTTYVVWDADARKVTYRRLPFDFRGYITEMLDRNVDMPGWLYQLLVWGQLMELGRGPSDNRGGELET